ncbi:MAG TPA: DMT family transporter [Terracidiphilus sp.]|jgi:transporter family protein
MALGQTLKARWFWYSLICVLCWGGYALCSKFGSTEIPPETMQFLFTIGALPVCLALLVARRFKLENSPKGIGYAVLNGVLSGIGGLTLFAAYHTDGNTSLITAASALYPMITVLLALTILRERLKMIQVVGLGFAAIALVIFSF